MRLQELPVEVLIKILELAGSLADLESFANASRKLYFIFQTNKASLIFHFLSNKLGALLVDALSLSEIEALDSSSPAYIDQLGEVLSRYSISLASQHNRRAARPVPRLIHVLRLARTYHYTVPIADVYLTCAVNLLDRVVRPSCPPTSLPNLLAPLSSVERLRVLRAHIRLHMMLHLSESLVKRPQEVDIGGMMMRLFGQWEPWELQQVFCVGSFYRRLRQRLNINFSRGRGGSGRMEVVTSRVCEFEAFWGFAGHVRRVGDAAWQEAVDTASKFVNGPKVEGFDEHFELSCLRRQVYKYSITTGTAERHKFPVSLRFDGDHEGAMPFGWVDAFGGHYGYNFLERSMDVSQMDKPITGLWARLGFVMWDERRVEALKTSSLLSNCRTGWAAALG
jgi:hypothetical protein